MIPENTPHEGARLTEGDLEAIRQRVEAATPGPWQDEVTDEGKLLVVMVDTVGHNLYFGDMEETCKFCHANAAFVAHARQDIPALLAEIEAQRRELAQWQDGYDKGLAGIKVRVFDNEGNELPVDEVYTRVGWGKSTDPEQIPPVMQIRLGEGKKVIKLESVIIVNEQEYRVWIIDDVDDSTIRILAKEVTASDLESIGSSIS